MPVVDMGVRDHMDQFARLHAAHLCQHVDQNRILAHIPVVCRQYILRSLVENTVQGQHITVLLFGHVKSHAVCARIQVHLMEVLMHIDICHNTTAVRIVLQIIDHTVRLIHHSFFVLMLYAHLISVCFSDGSVLISPAVPDMAFKIMYIVGLFLPYPQHLVHTAFDRRTPERESRELF